MSRFVPILPHSFPISRLLPQLALIRPPQARPRPSSRPRLGLERLEDRTVLSSFNLAVTSVADAGPGTLRAAITEADAGSRAHAYNIDFKVSGAISLESSLPDLSTSMNLNGPGARRLTVQRASSAQAGLSTFVVDAGAAVRITGMTITHGITNQYGSGGGINNNGTLALSRTTISNSSTGTLGGGIYNTGALTVSHSTISGDTDWVGDGGGIYNTGTLTVSHSTISGNLAFYHGSGGGIYNAGTLTVSQSTISDNLGGDGGGIVNTGTLTVRRSTFTGNLAGSSGGAIYNDAAGTLTVSHTTISRNSATAGGGIGNAGAATVSHTTITGNSSTDLGIVGGGGGIDNAGTLTLRQSTVSGNSAGNPNAGGGIDNTGTLTLMQTTVSRNFASSSGGGINNTGTLTANDTTINGNAATSGGGLYNSGGGQAVIDDSTMNDPIGGGLVNNGFGIGNEPSNVRVKKTVVDGVLQTQDYDP